MDTTLDRAWLLMGRSRFDRSEQEIRKHLSENPDDARAHTMLAMCLFDLSRHDDAIESAEKLLSIAPESADAHEVYAQALICNSRKIRSNEQNLNRILAILQESLRLDPSRPYAKILAHNLLVNYYSIPYFKVPHWLLVFVKIMTIATIPLLLLVFYFYNTCGFQIYPTGILLLATIPGLIFITEMTYTHTRIRLNSHHRIFLIPNPIIKLFWGSFIIITSIGIAWQLLPFWSTIIIIVLLLLTSIPVGLSLLILLQDTLSNVQD
jgi:tetratricopeptide (TPR) repeat protein